MKKMTLNNIYEWPLMTRLLLLGLICSASFYLGYRYDIATQSKILSQTIQTETDLKQQLELVVHKNKVIQAEIACLPDRRKELAKWSKQLINYNDLPELLNQILKIGGDNHLFFSLFTPGETVKITLNDVPSTPADASGTTPPATTPATPDAQAPAQPNPDIITYAKVPIKVVVVGSYHQLADFISQIANMPWIVSVGDFTISSDSQNPSLGDKLAKQAELQHLLTAEMTLDVYHVPESKQNGH